MLSDRVGEALALDTPTRALSTLPDSCTKVDSFNLEAKECLQSFLECNDLAIIFQVRREFELFCAKVLRSIDNLDNGDSANALNSQENKPIQTNLKELIVACQRRIQLGCEYYELKNVVLVAVEQELENLQDLVFQITEHKLSPNSRTKPHVGQLYDRLKAKVDPLKVSVELLPMRIECYSIDAHPNFESSVHTLRADLYTLKRKMELFMDEFNSLDRLLKPDWWDPALEVVSSFPVCTLSVPSQPNTTTTTASCIPVSNLRLRGQRKSMPPPKFVSRIPKPTEIKIKARPLSAPDQFAFRGHRHSSSQWSNCSTISQDSLPTIPEPVQCKPKIYEPTALLNSHNRLASRLIKPTPVDLTRLRHSINKENLEMPKQFDKRDSLLSTIAESPNRMSMIPKFSGSPAVRKHKRAVGVLGKPIR